MKTNSSRISKKQCEKKGLPEEIKKQYGRILLFSKAPQLKRIFGIASYSHSEELPIDISQMADTVMKKVELHPDISFRVTCQRIDKSLDVTSRDIEVNLGAELVKRTNAEVDLTEFDVEVGVELINKKAYVFLEKVKCFAGLPVGTQGTVLAQVESDADRLAALLMMRRGCALIPINTEQSDVLINYGALAPRNGSPDELAKETGAIAVITGQTLENIQPLNTSLIILRPLSGMTKQHITERLNEFMRH